MKAFITSRFGELKLGFDIDFKVANFRFNNNIFKLLFCLEKSTEIWKPGERVQA